MKHWPHSRRHVGQYSHPMEHLGKVGGKTKKHEALLFPEMAKKTSCQQNLHRIPILSRNQILFNETAESFHVDNYPHPMDPLGKYLDNKMAT